MLKPYSTIFSIPAAIILAISALFVIALTATQTPTTDSAAAPVTRAADGFSAAQAYALRQGYDTRKTAAAGDQTLYMYLNMPQFFPHHVISRSGPIRELPVKLNPEIGRLVVKTTLGDLSLDDMLKDPRSRVQGYIVIHRGRIVYERYPGMRPTDNHLWWSSGKTLPGLLTAQLAAEGKLDAGKPVEFYLPEFSASGWKGTPVHDLADHASGISAEELNVESYVSPKSELSRLIFAEKIVDPVAGQPVMGHNQALMSMTRKRPPGEAPVACSWQWDAVFKDGDFFKGGFHGQGIYVAPARDVVVAFFATTNGAAHVSYARAIAKSGLLR